MTGDSLSQDLPVRIAVEGREDVTIVRVEGDLDMATTPRLVARCRTLGTVLALDLSAVRFIDSIGIEGLLEIEEMKDRVTLVNPSGVVRRLLALTEMSGAFQIASSAADALNYQA